MKKYFILVALFVATVAFTSCDPNKTQCWKITVELQNGQKSEYLFWGDGMQSDAQMDMYQQVPDIKSVRKEQTFLSEQDCRQ